jgi:clan AA aspartic protease
MTGEVDQQQRALIQIQVSSTDVTIFQDVTAWIDTAFNGSLVIPRHFIDQLGLIIEATTEAVLADGTSVTLETVLCAIRWFGKIYQTQIIINDGELPLLGTQLLTGLRLTVDYENATVELVQVKS